MTVEGELLWEPAKERVAGSNIARFAAAVDRPVDYPALWQWSVEDLDGFWRALADWAGIRWSTPPTTGLAEAAMPGARWFPGGRLNYAEHALYPPAGVDKDAVAVLFAREDGRRRALTWREL